MAAFRQLARNIYRLELPFPGCWTGVTLWRGSENVLIDSGGCAETVDSHLVPALAEMGLRLSDIQWLVLTHIHGDHVGGCARIRALAPSLRVAAFAGSRERLRDPLAYSKAIRARFPAHSPDPPAVLDGVETDVLLADGDRLADGLRLLHTPGHDTDSCCFLAEESRTLITGDSLQGNGTPSQGCALLMDVAHYQDTLARLLLMEIENIVCGHPYLPLGAEALGKAASRRYLEECVALASFQEGVVAGMQAAGVDDAPTIARALIREIGGQEPAHLFLPLYTVTGYMEKRRNQP